MKLIGECVIVGTGCRYSEKKKTDVYNLILEQNGDFITVGCTKEIYDKAVKYKLHRISFDYKEFNRNGYLVPFDIELLK